MYLLNVILTNFILFLQVTNTPKMVTTDMLTLSRGTHAEIQRGINMFFYNDMSIAMKCRIFV